MREQAAHTGRGGDLHILERPMRHKHHVHPACPSHLNVIERIKLNDDLIQP